MSLNYIRSEQKLGEPAVYVGTYAKYNSGSLAGAWLKLADYSSSAEFYEACQELHGPGEHEFMFQDWENIPSGLIGESWLDDRVWEWMALDEEEWAIVMLYWECTDGDASIETALEAFAGTADSIAEFAENLAIDTCALPEDFPSWIVIDWNASWDCNLRFDYHAVRFNCAFYFFNANM